jgi:hypothetical protein
MHTPQTAAEAPVEVVYCWHVSGDVQGVASPQTPSAVQVMTVPSWHSDVPGVQVDVQAPGWYAPGDVVPVASHDWPAGHGVAPEVGPRTKLLHARKDPVDVQVPVPKKQTASPHTPLPAVSVPQTMPIVASQATAAPQPLPPSMAEQVWTPEPSGAQRVAPGVHTWVQLGV